MKKVIATVISLAIITSIATPAFAKPIACGTGGSVRLISAPAVIEPETPITEIPVTSCCGSITNTTDYPPYLVTMKLFTRC